MSFKDHFSSSAAGYATFRPTYPKGLFDFVAGLAPRRELAWDCATGNGQAALALAESFARVVATDASAAQLERAVAHPRIEYRLARAEESGLDPGTADLVTVAQALHWFDVAAFFAEVRRVLAPGGAIAVWTYLNPYLEERALDRVLQRFVEETVGPYWPRERALLLDGYQNLAFPFDEVVAPRFVLEHHWTLAEFAGYARTWSATTAYRAELGHDPVLAFEAEAAPLWGDPSERRAVRWPLVVRAGSNSRPA